MEDQGTSDRFCWSVFMISSSVASLSGLILLLTGFPLGAIPLSLGIQVSVIILVFYVWTRCWRRTKPSDVSATLEDPPPPYRSEWRITFLNTSDRNSLSQPVIISTATTPALAQSSRRDRQHSISIEETTNNMVARGLTLNMETSPGNLESNSNNNTERLPGRWSPRMLPIERLYRSNTQAQYSPLAIKNTGLPSYEEAMAQAQDLEQGAANLNKQTHLQIQVQDSAHLWNDSSRCKETFIREDKT